jgi:hypothetical protein
MCAPNGAKFLPQTSVLVREAIQHRMIDIK